MREFTVYAPAKLNLYLDVLDKRPDGYHNIETLFEKIDLKDEIIIREKKSIGIDIKIEPPEACPSGRHNIVYQAIEALSKEAEIDLNLEIIIKKKIPVSAGLGGGSSNAASVLRCINEHFGLGVDSEKLFTIASRIGKDVPFFMLDATFAKGMARGELLEPVDVDFSFSHIIIKPDISISTAEMYKRLDNYRHRTKKKGLGKVVSALKKRDLALLKESYYNIFEEVLGNYAKYIKKAKSLLEDVGVGPGFLSGSGPSVFCMLEEREEVEETAKRMQKIKGRDVFVATSCKN
jgi:4-diphosphocytidyl-2-C-methyl-D-erythritol kinase